MTSLTYITHMMIYSLYLLPYRVKISVTLTYTQAHTIDLIYYLENVLKLTLLRFHLFVIQAFYAVDHHSYPDNFRSIIYFLY